MNRKLLVIVLLSTGLVSGPAGATIFGIKSCGSNGVCNPGGASREAARSRRRICSHSNPAVRALPTWAP